MLPNLPANRLHIRRKLATSHHSRMKIAIGTLRLAERHLHVNPELPHHPKTLAHPGPIPLPHLDRPDFPLAQTCAEPICRTGTPREMSAAVTLMKKGGRAKEP